MNAVLVYKCGHKASAQFNYPQAAKDWQRLAKTELCPQCERADQKKQVG